MDRRRFVTSTASGAAGILGRPASGGAGQDHTAPQLPPSGAAERRGEALQQGSFEWMRRTVAPLPRGSRIGRIPFEA